MTRGRVIAAAAGLLALGLAALASRRGAPRAAAGAWLAADRDGGQVLELDADLFVLRAIPVAWPVAVRRGPPGQLWVASVPAGHARGARRLRLVDGAGEAGPALDVDELLDLAVDGEGRAVALVGDADGTRRLLRLDGAGGVDERSLPTTATRIAAQPGGEVLVAAGSRGLLLLGAGAPVHVQLGATRFPLDVARGPAGDWWLLCAEGSAGERVLARLDAELVPRWERPCRGARLAAPHPAAMSQWVLDAEGREVAAFGAHGEDLAGPVGLPGGPLAAAAVDAEGGLIAAAGGALLRFSARGAARPGQGRLDHLVDLSRR